MTLEDDEPWSEEQWADEWRQIIRIVHQWRGDVRKLGSYGSPLMGATAEPGETIRLLRRNGERAVEEVESGNAATLAPVRWDMIAIGRRILSSMLEDQLLNQPWFFARGGWDSRVATIRDEIWRYDSASRRRLWLSCPNCRSPVPLSPW